MLAIYLAVGALTADCTGGAANNCAQGKCEMVGTTQICTQCNTDYVPINGKCAEATSASNCKNAEGTSQGNQVCGKCEGATFMFKGGCYDKGGEIGNLICTDAASGTAGVCQTCNAANGYFKNPEAANNADLCVSCGDATGVTVDTNKKYVGVANCAKCTEPAAISGDTGGTAIATCTKCTSNKLSPLGDACLAACPAGTYNDNNICKPCHTSCSSCSDAASTSCTACYPGRVLSKGETGNTGTCIPECTGRYAENCEKDMCTAVLGGSKYCSKCKSGFVPVDGLCVSAGTTRVALTGCTPGTDGTCSACKDAYFKESGGCYLSTAYPGNTLCSQAANGQCSQCANGQTQSSGSCPACPAGCSKCSGSGDPKTCSECLAGYYKTSANTCVKCDTDDSNIKGVPNCVSCAAPANSGPVTCYVTQAPAVDPTDPSVNKGGLSSGAIAGISITVTTIIGRPVDKMSTYIIHTSVSAIVRPIQSPYPSPKTSVADKHSRMPTPATGGSSVPAFTAKDICKRIDSVLGRGSLGTVYSIKGHPGLAVKEVPIDEQEEGSVNTIRSELAALVGASHPGFLRCHQVIVDDSFAYVVTDRYHDTLGSVIISHMRARKAVPRELLLSIVRQITSALAYLHGIHGVDASGDLYQGVVHRDLKPDNVLISEDGSRLVLADFGLCKDALRSGTTLAGTKPYMAPEVFIHHKTSPASNVWALGVIIYELATLKRPNFLGDKEPKDVFINGWKLDLSSVKGDSIRIILEKIFVLDPEERPTARDLCELLRVSDASVVRMRLRAMMLEEALNEANARIASLEKELQTKIDDLERWFTGVFETLPKHDMQASAHHTSASAPLSAAVSPALPALEKSVSCTPLVHAAIAGDAKAAEGRLSGDDQMNDSGDAVSVPATGTSSGDGAEPLNPASGQVATALMSAAERGDVEAVRALMPFQKEWRANLFGSGKTALMMAAMCGHTEVVGYWWSTRAVDRIKAARRPSCERCRKTTLNASGLCYRRRLKWRRTTVGLPLCMLHTETAQSLPGHC
ncbi:Variant-specific surface protein [Giardia duodenalis]|uniref:Variant-specific surface protein n=1 Tax=Giardia intestinalis TaxID=5741 RepID=V6TNP2_GIAIN|nr:Variant-specific surface protein [Giardia intestinalis]